MTGEEIRWGLENLKIDEARAKALGASGLISPISISCKDHEGGGAVMFMEWNGNKWIQVSDWIETDQSIVRPMIEAEAAKYAEEKGITPRTGQSMGSNCA